ncbi:MAG: 4-hydroxybenzoate decarboxylase [Proteobacteria bacterium]|nr:MAG: 4-hydroxybenzoate decarboxylase [Pseudomonadota bacterium]
MYTDLQAFVEALRRECEIVEIGVEVDPHLEAAEIHRRVIENQGPALLFRRIKGSPFPLVTNLFGTPKRIEMAFGTRPQEFVRQAAKLPETLLPPSFSKLWQHRSLLRDLLRIGMKRRAAAPVKARCISPPKLGTLPLLTTWERDGGAFITLPLVYTEHPLTHLHNLGMYRMQRFDDATTGMHCQIGKGGGFHLAEAKRLGQKLPVNVFIGGPPALILSAIAPLPENVPELLLASLVQGKKLDLTRSSHGPLPLIANAEFALVGEVDPDEMRPEGPFGDHYGYYSLQHDYPVFRCKALYHRKNPICAATVVGKPRQEDFYLGDYLQELLSPLFPVVMPAVEDLWSYGETGFHSLAAAVVKQRYKREAMASAFRILGEGQLSLTKFLLVVDKRQDLRNFKEVLKFVLERCAFRTDLYVFSNLSMDTLDYTGPKVNHGSKGVMLGVGDPIRKLPAQFSGELPAGITEAKIFCDGCIVIGGKSFAEDSSLPATIANYEGFREWPLIILSDQVKMAAESSSYFLWSTFTRFEPGADLHAAAKTIERNHIAYHPPIVIDARMKPGYPDELECDSRTQELVERRWSEYFYSN